jgi:hypothetical protein
MATVIVGLVPLQPRRKIEKKILISVETAMYDLKFPHG